MEMSKEKIKNNIIDVKVIQVKRLPFVRSEVKKASLSVLLHFQKCR